jgi:hypothetical protein
MAHQGQLASVKLVEPIFNYIIGVNTEHLPKEILEKLTG